MPLRVKIYALLLTFFLALLLSADAPIWGDAFQTCGTARALIEKGSFKIHPAFETYPAGDGLAYTKYGLVYVLSCVPSVLAEKLVEKVAPHTYSAQKLGLSLTPAVILALFMGGFLKLGTFFAPPRAWLVALAFVIVFATPLWVNSRTLYSEGVQSCCLVWLLVFFFLSWEKQNLMLPILVGFIYGLLINIKAIYFPLALLIGFWLSERSLAPRDRINKLGLAAIGFAPCLFAWAMFNQLRFGHFFSLSYTLGRDQTFGFSNPFYVGIYGLLFSSGKSVFVYAPVLLLCIRPWLAFFRQMPRHALAVLVVLLVFLGIYSHYWAWHGDWAWGPRYLAPVIPLFALALAIKPPPATSDWLFSGS